MEWLPQKPRLFLSPSASLIGVQQVDHIPCMLDQSTSPPEAGNGSTDLFVFAYGLRPLPRTEILVTSFLGLKCLLGVDILSLSGCTRIRTCVNRRKESDWYRDSRVIGNTEVMGDG